MRSLQAYKAYKNFFKGIRVFVLTFGDYSLYIAGTFEGHDAACVHSPLLCRIRKIPEYGASVCGSVEVQKGAHVLHKTRLAERLSESYKHFQHSFQHLLKG